MPLLHRRQLLSSCLLAGASVITAPRARAEVASRSLAVLNLHTGERLKATFWESGAYLKDALAGFDKVLRDHRTGEVHPIAPSLLDLVADLQDRTGVSGPVQIISGYRSPQTNAGLQKAGSGVATHSLHMDGKALDIRIPGLQLSRLRDAAVAMQRGGVGFYTESNFVHVDVGRVRRW
jgi:uncharacterized protein YcbK (DUF882 family)